MDGEEGKKQILKIVPPDETQVDFRDVDDNTHNEMLSQIKLFLKDKDVFFQIEQLKQEEVTLEHIQVLHGLLRMVMKLFNQDLYNQLSRDKSVGSKMRHDLSFIASGATVNFEILEKITREWKNGDVKKLKDFLGEFKKYSTAFALGMQDILLRKLKREDKFKEQIVVLDRKNITVFFEAAYLAATEGIGENLNLRDKLRISKFNIDLAENERIEVVPGVVSSFIVNMLNNAAKEEIGSEIVDLAVFREGDELVIRIADHGKGRADVKKMFFGQSDTGSTGLGLKDANIRARNSNFGLRGWTRVKGENGNYGAWNFYGQDNKGDQYKSEIAPPLYFIENRSSDGKDMSVPVSTAWELRLPITKKDV